MGITIYIITVVLTLCEQFVQAFNLDLWEVMAQGMCEAGLYQHERDASGLCCIHVHVTVTDVHGLLRGHTQGTEYPHQGPAVRLAEPGGVESADLFEITD